MFTRIVTHFDLDGIVSAMLCAGVHGVDTIDFTGPNIISRQGYTSTLEDIFCDLPYPGECGLWFDHHTGNYEELKRLGKNPDALPGVFAPEKSCARVIYNYYKDDYEFPGFYGETVAAVDRIDSFDFESIEEWRTMSPLRIVDGATKYPFESRELQEDFYRYLIEQLMEYSMDKVARDELVERCFIDFCRLEDRMMDIIRERLRFHPADRKRGFAIIDLTCLNKKTRVERNLAQILHPEIDGVFLIQNLFDRGVKSNHFSISGSLTIKGRHCRKDIGEIMRRLNIGDGHAGAGSGQVSCSSKAEMEKKREAVIERVFRLWSEQV